MNFFERQELNTLTKKELSDFANYYGLKHAKTIRKEYLIDLIVEKLYSEPEMNQENENIGVQMSVRVKRLKEINDGI